MPALKKRTTIGFLCANIHVRIARTLWPGVIDAARDLGVNLICFPGGGLGVQARGEAQRNIIYEMATAHHLDGLASWSSTLGVALSQAAVSDFHRRFAGLPLISLSQSIAGIPSILLDNISGMRAAVLHLLDTHHLHRLVLVRGPESHFSAQERYQAFVEVLAERGIACDPNLITPPLQWNDAELAPKILLDERGLVPGRDFDGIVASSDLFALAMVKALQARGVAIPQTVAIVGFNNITESQLTHPPLTSVELNFRAQGYQVVQELLEIIQEGASAELSRLPCSLVVRQSCGCPAQAVIEAALDYPGGSPAEAGDSAGLAWEERLYAELQQYGARANWAKDLVAAFRGALHSGLHWDFLRTFESILHQANTLDEDLTSWQAVVSCLRRRFLPGLDPAGRSLCEDLCGQARVIIAENTQRAQVSRQLRAEHQADTLREIGQALITTFDIEKLSQVLVERLPQLGISSCFLALYENPLDPLANARLVLACAEGKRLPLEPGGLSYPTRQLVPENLLPENRFSLVAEALHFQQEQIGVVLFEIGAQDGVVYEVLRAQISSALKGALLFREVQDQKHQLAESEARLKELSIRDPLTGLHNRRFLEEAMAQELLKGCQQQLTLGVIMIDIDHFKRFNDLYGHATGDELLRQLGKLFLSHVRGSDVACRYGGEEFVIVLPEASLETTRQRAEFLRQAANQILVYYNTLMVGRITLSLGIAVYPQHGVDSATLLKAADNALYRAKDEGRNRVVVTTAGSS